MKPSKKPKLLRVFRSFAIGAFFAICGAINSLYAQESIPANQPIIIEREINGDKLRMVSTPYHAGAFSSMVFRGQEYINADDHGRLFQGAIAFNGRFECNNPTQAGASRDEKNWRKRSTSKRLSAQVDDEYFVIITQMAYWLRPNQECNIPNLGKSKTDNRSRLSRTQYINQSAWNQPEGENIIKFNINYLVDEPHKSAVVEALTIHTPPVFNRFDILSSDNQFTQIIDADKPDETHDPVVLSTQDGQSAIAFYSPESNTTYAHWRFSFLSKISLVDRSDWGETRERGIIGVDGYWMIGTRAEVMAALIKLREAYPPSP